MSFCACCCGAGCGDEPDPVHGEIKLGVWAYEIWRVENAWVRAVLIEARPPAYPRLARRAQWEGVAVCRITVSPEGDVTRVSIARSSGYEILDEAALAALRTWRFEPGLRKSVAAEVALLHSVRFQLRSE